MHDTCVIFNPTAGKNRAGRRLRNLQKDWAGRVDFLPTQGPGHAVELAVSGRTNGYRVVTAAGGDGTVHEVVNGLAPGSAARRAVCHRAHRLGQRFRPQSRLASNRNPGTVCTVDAGVVRDPPAGRRRVLHLLPGSGIQRGRHPRIAKVRGFKAWPSTAWQRCEPCGTAIAVRPWK